MAAVNEQFNLENILEKYFALQVNVVTKAKCTNGINLG